MRVVVALLALLAADRCLPAPAADKALQSDVNDLVDFGFEEPQRALSQLRAMKDRAVGPTAQRIVETGIGLVAADNHLFDEARASIGRLEGLVATAGPLAHGDALLIRSDMENSADESQAAMTDAMAAVAAYAPFCDATQADDLRACNSFDWFHANLFAGIFISAKESRGTATMYLSAAREIAAQSHRPDHEARALAFMAQLAQAEGNAASSDRALQRAAVLAQQSGQASAQEFVAVFTSLVLKSRGDFAGALAPLQQAIAIAHRAGHARRSDDLELDMIDLQLDLGRAGEALVAIDRLMPRQDSRHIDPLDNLLTQDKVEALLQLGRTAEARQILPPLLDALDHRLGLVERSDIVSALGQAMLKAGAIDDATALFAREQAAIRAGGDRVFERLMLDRQDASQARQLQERRTEIHWWSAIAAVAVAVVAGFAGVVPWLRSRNRRLASANAALQERSERDPLTGLLNRDGLGRALRELGRVDAFQGALLLVDIDHFKQVNDTLGHAGGDVVLQEVARRLQGCVRDGDFVVRWGGEELVVAVLSTPFDADALVDRILAALAASPVAFQQRTVGVSASIGYGAFPLDEAARALSFDEALAVADAGMYYAKRHGRRAAVRISALPLALLDDLGGLPDAVEQAMLVGEVRLALRRAPAAPTGGAPIAAAAGRQITA